MLDSDQRELHERGFVRVPGAFPREQAASMEARVWAWLYAVSRSEPATWRDVAPTGLQDLKRQSIFDAIGSGVTCCALDALRASIGGVPVRVVELAVEAGDLEIGRPWLLRAGAPNYGTQPRMMRVQRVQAA